MNYKVVKFGGSNLKDSQGIKKVVKAVTEYNRPLIIVVSAFYGVTNNLIDAIQHAKEDKLNVDDFIQGLSTQKINTFLEIVSDKQLALEFKCELENRLHTLKSYFLGISYIKDIPPFVYDEILSYGERLSSLLLLHVLKQKGFDCKEALPEAFGLLTDGEFGNATVNFKGSIDNLNQYFSSDQTYIVPGFYGISDEGKTTILGRGGSDYSASAIAACLSAESLDLWKDVPGFLSADPRIVEDAVVVDSLTYAEAAELAYFGSKILHPRTPEPLAKRNIPIRLFNIENVDDGQKPATIINGKETITEKVIKSVSYSDDFGMLKLLGSGVGVKPGILAKSTSELDNAGINIKSVITSQTIINILLSQKDLYRAKSILEKKDIHGVSEIEVCGDISLIAAVGEGLTTQYGIAGRMFSAVARRGINIQIISFGASPVAVYFIVHKKDRNETISEIHKDFFVYDCCCERCI